MEFSGDTWKQCFIVTTGHLQTLHCIFIPPDPFFIHSRASNPSEVSPASDSAPSISSPSIKTSPSQRDRIAIPGHSYNNNCCNINWLKVAKKKEISDKVY